MVWEDGRRGKEMSESKALGEFAALLEDLKVRSGRSYEALARRIGLGPSTLHRYCTGRSLPTEASLVTRIAAVCGADPRETQALVRLWHVADAVRHRPALADAPNEPRWTPRSDLPRDIADFTGRAEELRQLLAPDGAVAAVRTIDGMAGVGKTTLAVHASHLLVERYPDAQLFLDLHAHTAGARAVSPADGLESLLNAVGVAPDRIPQRTDQRAALWRSTLVGRHTLVVLDNALDAAQVQDLIPGQPGCLTLITSRNRLVDLDAADTLTLDVLPPDDAATLFTRTCLLYTSPSPRD